MRLLRQRRRLRTWRRGVDRDDVKVSSQPGVNAAAGLVGRASAALLHFNQQASWWCADSQAHQLPPLIGRAAQYRAHSKEGEVCQLTFLLFLLQQFRYIMSHGSG